MNAIFCSRTRRPGPSQAGDVGGAIACKKGDYIAIFLRLAKAPQGWNPCSPAGSVIRVDGGYVSSIRPADWLVAADRKSRRATACNEALRFVIGAVDLIVKNDFQTLSS
jgi:hypothetical protein